MKQENVLEIYLPFNVRGIRTGFIDDLRREIETYFESPQINTLESRFVAFSINDANNYQESIQHMVEDVPMILRVVGYNKITPLIV